MFALAMAARNRRPFVSAEDRLAAPPRAPDRLRAGPVLGDDRHALLELVSRLPRHPHRARRHGDLAVASQRIEGREPCEESSGSRSEGAASALQGVRASSGRMKQIGRV